MKLKKETNKLPLNIQFFADGDGTETGQGTGEGNDNQNTEPKTFDELLKDKAYQSEFDKRIAKALETAKGKWEVDAQRKIEDAKTEAEKLAKMNADQKAQYEREKQEADFQKRLADLSARELKATAKEALSEKGLPLELADVLNYADADACNKSIEVVERAFYIAVKAEVEKRLGSTTPKTSNSNTDVQITKEQFNKMNINQQTELYKTNKELYMQLANQ